MKDLVDRQALMRARFRAAVMREPVRQKATPRLERRIAARRGLNVHRIGAKPLGNTTALAIAMMESEAATDHRNWKPRKLKPRRKAIVRCPGCGRGKSETRLTYAGTRKCDLEGGCGREFMPSGFAA